MFKKIIVIVIAALLPVIVVANIACAQMQQAVESIYKNNEFFVIYQFASLKPVNDFLQNLPDSGFSAYNDNVIYYGISSKNTIGDNFYWGITGATTLGGLDALEPNLLSREKAQGGSGTNNLAELSMMFTEVTFDYQFVKLGGFYVTGGCGIGFGGARLTIFGNDGTATESGKNGRFGMISMLIDPKFGAGYNFEGQAGSGIILSLNGGFNCFPNCSAGWWKEAGSIGASPKPFDMNGWYINFNVGIPTEEIPNPNK